MPGRAEDLPGRGHRGGVDHVGDTEIGELQRAVFVEEHVLWLDVAVHDPRLVRRLERLGDLDHEARRDLGRHVELSLRLVLPPALEGRPGEELGGDERLVGALAAEVVDLEHAGMAKASDASGLALKTPPRLFRPPQVRMHHLERHLALQNGVVRAVHRGHPTVPDLLFDLVFLELAEHRRLRPRIRHPTPRNRAGSTRDCKPLLTFTEIILTGGRFAVMPSSETDSSEKAYSGSRAAG